MRQQIFDTKELANVTKRETPETLLAAATILFVLG
jgi:hypothetical protein